MLRLILPNVILRAQIVLLNAMNIKSWGHNPYMLPIAKNKQDFWIKSRRKIEVNLQVKAETAYQAQRLYHHASIAIWGGNNEVETSFTWFPESSANTDLFVSNYNKLFVDTIREELLAVDENINFVDSSPSKGIYSLDPYTKR